MMSWRKPFAGAFLLALWASAAAAAPLAVGNDGFRRAAYPDYTSPFGSLLTAQLEQLNIFLTNEFRVRAPARGVWNRSAARFAIAASTLNPRQSAPGADAVHRRSLALSEPDLLALGLLELPTPAPKKNQSLLESLTSPPSPTPIQTVQSGPSYTQTQQFNSSSSLSTPTYQIVDFDSVYLSPEFSSPETYYRSMMLQSATEAPEPSTLGVTLVMLALAFWLARRRLRTSRSSRA